MSLKTGWFKDRTNNRLDFYYEGTRIGHINANGLYSALLINAGTTITAGTGWTDTTGNTTNSAGDFRCTAGNLRLGAINTFANTEPTSAAVMKVGTAPVGAVATSGAVFASSTVVRKIIADGTASNIQT